MIWSSTAVVPRQCRQGDGHPSEVVADEVVEVGRGHGEHEGMLARRVQRVRLKHARRTLPCPQVEDVAHGGARFNPHAHVTRLTGVERFLEAHHGLREHGLHGRRAVGKTPLEAAVQGVQQAIRQAQQVQVGRGERGGVRVTQVGVAGMLMQHVPLDYQNHGGQRGAGRWHHPRGGGVVKGVRGEQLRLVESAAGEAGARLQDRLGQVRLDARPSHQQRGGLGHRLRQIVLHAHVAKGAIEEGGGEEVFGAKGGGHDALELGECIKGGQAFGVEGPFQIMHHHDGEVAEAEAEAGRLCTIGARIPPTSGAMNRGDNVYPSPA